MILESIQIQNIRSISEFEMIFSRGITLFGGDIGSGKSSILMAIEFALFGLGSQRPDSLLRKTADTASVILNFSVGEKSYEIKRILKRSENTISQPTRSSYILCEGNKEFLSPSDLKTRILQILKFNEPPSPRSSSRIFRYGVFTPQEEMKAILGNAMTRLETIRKAFGIEKYETIARNASGLLAEINANMRVLKERFRDIDGLILSKQDHLEQSRSIRDRITGLEDEQRNLDSKRSEISAEISGIQKDILALTKLKEQQKSYRDTITASNRHLLASISHEKKFITLISAESDRIGDLKRLTRPTGMSISDITESSQHYLKLEKEITGLRPLVDQLTRDVAVLKERLGNNTDPNKLDREIAEIGGRLDEKRTERSKLQKLFEAGLEQKSSILADKSQLESRLKKTIQLGEICISCNRPIQKDEVEALKRGIEDELSGIRIRLSRIATDEISRNRDDLDSEIRSLEDTAMTQRQLVPDICQWQRKSGELAAKKSSLESALNQYTIDTEEAAQIATNDPVMYLKELREKLVAYEQSQKETASCQVRVDEAKSNVASSQKEQQDIQIKINDLNEKLDRTSQEIKEYEGIPGTLAQKEALLDETSAKISSTKSSHAVSIQKFNDITKNMDELDERISDAQKWQMQYRVQSDCKAWLSEFFIPIVSNIEREVMRSVLYDFNSVYQTWYEKLVEDDTKESRIDENFTPLVEQDGYEQKVDYLSGGEKTSVALSYRLTLNSLMRKHNDTMQSNLLMLDEPTDGFSAEQIHKVKDILKEMDSEQIILVSHDRTLESYVDNLVHLYKENGVTKVHDLR